MRRARASCFLGSTYYTLADHNSLAPGTKTVNLGNINTLGITADDPITASATDASGNTSEFLPTDLGPTPTPTPSPTCPDVNTPVLTSQGSASGVPVTIPVNTSDLTGLGVIIG